jgi:uncharacterized protein
LKAVLTPGRHVVQGPVGRMEVLVDSPLAKPTKGCIFLAHPQPLLGGHAEHKVPQFLAKGFSEAGFIVVRPNFRGVGRSEGVHDDGNGEADDMLELIRFYLNLLGEVPLVLAGFSFGAFVQARVAHALEEQARPASKICLAGMPFGQVGGGRSFDPPQGIRNALVLHGEMDERVPLSSILDWARPSNQVVRVLPGADHFFTGRLHILRQQMLEFIQSSAQ